MHVQARLFSASLAEIMIFCNGVAEEVSQTWTTLRKDANCYFDYMTAVVNDVVSAQVFLPMWLPLCIVHLQGVFLDRLEQLEPSFQASLAAGVPALLLCFLSLLQQYSRVCVSAAVCPSSGNPSTRNWPVPVQKGRRCCCAAFIAVYPILSLHLCPSLLFPDNDSDSKRSDAVAAASSHSSTAFSLSDPELIALWDDLARVKTEVLKCGMCSVGVLREMIMADLEPSLAIVLTSPWVTGRVCSALCTTHSSPLYMCCECSLRR